jgi:hypothetical protein
MMPPCPFGQRSGVGAVDCSAAALNSAAWSSAAPGWRAAASIILASSPTRIRQARLAPVEDGERRFGRAERCLAPEVVVHLREHQAHFIV